MDSLFVRDASKSSYPADTCRAVLHGNPATIHLLGCGHMVKTKEVEVCGHNCQLVRLYRKFKPGYRFRCKKCAQKARPLRSDLGAQRDCSNFWVLGLPGNEVKDAEERANGRTLRSTAAFKSRPLDGKSFEPLESSRFTRRGQRAATRNRSRSPERTSETNARYREREALAGARPGIRQMSGNRTANARDEINEKEREQNRPVNHKTLSRPNNGNRVAFTGFAPSNKPIQNVKKCPQRARAATRGETFDYIAGQKLLTAYTSGPTPDQKAAEIRRKLALFDPQASQAVMSPKIKMEPIDEEGPSHAVGENKVFLEAEKKLRHPEDWSHPDPEVPDPFLHAGFETLRSYSPEPGEIPRKPKLLDGMAHLAL